MDNNELTQDLAEVVDSELADNTLPFASATVPARSRIGRFLIDREVGRGGFGVVYLAIDEVLKRSVALKIPREEMDQATKERFLREAEAAASLDHPGLVSVFEAGEVDGICYMASAYCDGGTLAQWLTAQSSVPLRVTAKIVQSLAEAIQHAYDRGVVHRDLKPRNVMLTSAKDAAGEDEPPFVARVTDFGLAKVAE
mgnify:FL=1